MQNRQPKPIGTSTTSKLQIKLINGRTFGPVVILVSVDAAQLDSVCRYFVGMAAWNGSASLSTGNSTLRNTSKYKQQRAHLMGSPWFLLPWLKINLSLTDFIWLILEITFHLWYLEHNPQAFNVSLASSSYLSRTPNCSSRNACRTAASAFQRHTSAVVPWLTWQHGTDRSWQWWKICESIILHKARLMRTELLLELTTTTCRALCPTSGCFLAAGLCSATAQGSLKTPPPFSSTTAVSEALPDIKTALKVWFYISLSALRGCFLEKKNSLKWFSMPKSLLYPQQHNCSCTSRWVVEMRPKISMETLQFSST